MPSYLRAIVVALLGFALVNTVWASDLKVVEKQAMMEYYGHNLLLTRPYVNNKLRFNSAGALLGPSEEGPWTTTGIIHVDNIELKPNRIRVSGKREIIILRTENGKLGLQPIYLTKSMEVELEPTTTIRTLDDVKQTMARVFHEENIGRKLNQYFRGTVTFTGVDPKTGRVAMAGGRDGIYGYLDDRPIYLPTKEIDLPKVTHKENAEYTEAARVKRTQGKMFMMVVVDEKGYPAILHLLKDLGDDMDIQTLAATSQWRFNPAKKDGKPVASIFQVGWEAVTY
ncbi:MAG TPA: energy transducer TonB [Terriglobales bacterium]|nr:energy transducer TonB [Terriglobales bacterium]